MAKSIPCQPFSRYIKYHPVKNGHVLFTDLPIRNTNSRFHNFSKESRMLSLKTAPSGCVLFLCILATVVLSATTLTPGDADHRDDCWATRSCSGCPSGTWGIKGTRETLDGEVTWNSFPGSSGWYKCELGAILESDGDSPWKLLIGGTAVSSGRYPYADGGIDCDGDSYVDQYIDMGTHEIQNGQQIKYWAQSVYPCGPSHGQYSRFYEIRFTPASDPGDDGTTAPTGTFYESNGLVVIEAESIDPGKDWVQRSGSYDLDGSHTTSGASGNACLMYRGGSECGSGVNGEMTYNVNITNPGTYRLYIRAMGAPMETDRGDCANDCFVKMPGQTAVWLSRDLTENA